MSTVKVGLLPLYVQLYDESSPQMRPVVEAFYEKIAGQLEERGLSVLRAPVCCIKRQFEEAISRFEEEGAQVLITLHLAYSPSLESEGPLSATKLPLIVLDTTPDAAFTHEMDSEAINYNHGIHGVQDMCCLLRRNGKPFEIFAGHWQHSDVLDQVVRAARVASILTRLHRAKVGLVGQPFQGMGDFAVPEERLRAELGIQVEHYDLNAAGTRLRAVRDEEIDRECAQDEAQFAIGDVPLALRRDTERVGLAVRQWIAERGLSAFSMNFQEAGLSEGFPTMPFSEASKAMARGIGYAGEGDVLTAALVGALLGSFPETTFAEMFCPDWVGNTIYFSHMGEFNLKVCAGKPHMILKDFPYAPGFDPSCLMGHFKPGAACLVNLAPGPDGRYALIVADGELIELPETIGSFENAVSGWFRPHAPLNEFLAAYSRAGGTHHSALVYGATAAELATLASLAGFERVIL